MIIDTHVHVWSDDTVRYPWQPVGGYIPEHGAPVESLVAVMDANGVDRAVLVQPTPYGWDNSYLLDAVRAFPDRFKAVCLVNPFDSHNASEMERLVQQEQAVGFRLNWNQAPLDAWEDSGTHRSLWEAASALRVPVCIQCTMEHLPLLQQMSVAYPAVRIVIDHLARIQVGESDPDKGGTALLKLARNPSVFIKISGLYYCSRSTPPFQDLIPIIKEVINEFGATRCIWGSDFPFILERWDYSLFCDYFESKLHLPAEEQSWILGKTARQLWWAEG